MSVGKVSPGGCLKLGRLLTHRRLPTSSEKLLQDAIGAILEAAEIPFEREVALSREDIIDFLVDGHWGVEVKIDGALSAVTRQLHRYMQSERVSGIALVTTRMRHFAIPRELHGKPIDLVHLIGGAL